MLLVGRPQLFLEPNPQPGKPPVLICPSALILVLSSGSSMPSRAKRTPPKTLFFPTALPLFTLPINMPLIFAHIYLKQHPVPRAEPNDSLWMNFGKLAVRMLLPSTIHSAPPSWLNSPLPFADLPFPLHLALTRLHLPESAQFLLLFSTSPSPLILPPLVGNLPSSSPFTNLENPPPLLPPHFSHLLHL